MTSIQSATPDAVHVSQTRPLSRHPNASVLKSAMAASESEPTYECPYDYADERRLLAGLSRPPTAELGPSLTDCRFNRSRTRTCRSKPNVRSALGLPMAPAAFCTRPRPANPLAAHSNAPTSSPARSRVHQRTAQSRCATSHRRLDLHHDAIAFIRTMARYYAPSFNLG